MALDGKVAAALALHRFGLGPSLGSRSGAIAAIESDPRGAVLAGLDRPNAGRIVNAELLSSGEAARSAIAFQQAQREMRREARKTTPKPTDPFERQGFIKYCTIDGQTCKVPPLQTTDNAPGMVICMPSELMANAVNTAPAIGCQEKEQWKK